MVFFYSAPGKNALDEAEEELDAFAEELLGKPNTQHSGQKRKAPSDDERSDLSPEPGRSPSPSPDPECSPGPPSPKGSMTMSDADALLEELMAGHCE
jgi:hypothetical protein